MSGVTHLPPLRHDLKLLDEQADEYGDRRWLIFDPTQNRYFSIGRRALELLRHWREGAESGEFLQGLEEHGIAIEAQDLDELVVFLARNDLIRSRDTAGAERLVKRAQAGKRSTEATLLHNYLFVRIPLLRPDRFLGRTLPAVAWLYQRWVVMTVIALGGVGVFLVSRQLDAFIAFFRESLSAGGLIFYGISFVVIKILHEFAHGYAAKRLGCRVASMGLALIVLFPILYTDTTDTWRVRDRARRMGVVLAGLKLEIYIACLATFAWAILPDGQWRAAAFYLATTGWLTSALVNLSPLLRFDGYYFFSDWIGVENLQHRGFALGRWQLRRVLFGIDDPCPEHWDAHKRRTVLIYAYATWVYRFFLFLGIALLVYHLAFKVLGIFLFVVEIYWFIARPVIREMGVWWKRRGEMRFSPVRALVAVGIVGVLVWLAVPLPRQLSVPAVLEAERQAIYAPEPARVKGVAVAPGDSVVAGDVLLELASPALMAEQARLSVRRRAAEQALTAGEVSRGALPLLRDRLQDIVEREDAVNARLAALTLTAPMAGRIEGDRLPRVGEWVGADARLAEVVHPERLRIRALLRPEQLEQLDTTADARFHAAWPRRQDFAVTPDLRTVVPVERLPYPEMARGAGGPIAVAAAAGASGPAGGGAGNGAATTAGNGKPPLDGAHYLVAFTRASPASVPAATRQLGEVVMRSQPRSRLADGLRRVYAVLLRELQF